MFEDSEIKQNERITKNMCGGRIEEKKPEDELIIFVTMMAEAEVPISRDYPSGSWEK